MGFYVHEAPGEGAFREAGHGPDVTAGPRRGGRRFILEVDGGGGSV